MDEWEQKSNMSTTRSAVTAAVYNQKIYVFGGYYDSFDKKLIRTDAVEIYDPETDTWSQGANMPTARSWSSAITLDNKIFVIGGTDNNKSLRSIVEVYDPLTNSWTRMNNMPLSIQGMGAVVLNDEIYVIGGWDLQNKFMITRVTFGQ